MDARAQTAADAMPESMRWIMGTYLRIVVVDPGVSEADARAAMDEAFERVERWNAWISPWVDDSHLRRIAARAPEWVRVPPVVFDYFARSRDDGEKTGGVFDVTVGGLFADPLAPVDWRRLELDVARSSVRLSTAGMVLDPGGNGKGVAVDAAVAALRAAGVRRALVDFGGSSWYALGASPTGGPWQIGLADPSGKVVATARLMDQALSTSSSLRVDRGDAEEVPGFHIVDPRTGETVRARRSVAAVSASATDAEVISTALVVLGPSGFSLLEAYPGTTAVVLTPGDATASAAGLGWWAPGPPTRSPVPVE